MNVLKYKNYVGIFEFDPEARIFHGEVAHIRDVVTFQGKSVEELEQAFKDSVEDYLELCTKIGKKPGKPYSGEVKVRLGSDLHGVCASAATAAGLSLNTWMKTALEKEARRVLAQRLINENQRYEEAS